MGTAANDDQFREPTIAERRYNRIKHLKVDRYQFVQMVPVLIEEGLLPEHGKHVTMPTVVKGDRTLERSEEVCARCENTITQQWRRNVGTLSTDEVEFMEAKWTWIAEKERIIDICRRDFKSTERTMTVRRKRVVAKPGEVWPITFTDRNGEVQEALIPSEHIVGIAFITETTETTQTVTYPKLLELASTVRNELARVAGLDIDEGDEDRDTQDERQGARYVILKPPPERSGGAGGRGRGSTVN